MENRRFRLGLAWLLLVAVWYLGLVNQKLHASDSGGGYLSKAPTGLRFAAPPKPPVANLGPTGIPKSSSPQLTEEFKSGPEVFESKPVMDHRRLRPAVVPNAPIMSPSELTFQTLVKYFKVEPTYPIKSDLTVKFRPPVDLPAAGARSE